MLELPRRHTGFASCWRLSPAPWLLGSDMIHVGIRVESDEDVGDAAGVSEVFHHLAALAGAAVALCLVFKFINLYREGVGAEVEEDVGAAARAASLDALVEGPVNVWEAIANEMPYCQLLASIEACSLVVWEQKREAANAVALVC